MRTTDAKDKVADALESLLSAGSADKISVSTIADAAEISRQTFYYHFQNVFDVYRYTLEQAMPDPNEKGLTPPDAIASVCGTMKKYPNMTHAFIHKTFRRDTIEILIEYLTHVVRRYISDKYGWTDPAQNPDDVPRFFATGYVCIIMRWADDDMKNDVAARIDKINQGLSSFHSYCAQKP